MRRPRNDGEIFVHYRYHYYNDTHIEYCSSYCLNVKSRETEGIDDTKIENFPGNATLEVTTGQFENSFIEICDGDIDSIDLETQIETVDILIFEQV